MLTKSVIKLQAYFLAFVSLVMIVSINCLARNAEYPTENTVSASVIQQDDSEYEAYVESCSIESNAKEDNVIYPENFVADSKNIVISDIIKRNDVNGRTEAEVTIPDDALYNVSISYRLFG